MFYGFWNCKVTQKNPISEIRVKDFLRRRPKKDTDNPVRNVSKTSGIKKNFRKSGKKS